jgi:hypothetical protein
MIAAVKVEKKENEVEENNDSGGEEEGVGKSYHDRRKTCRKWTPKLVYFVLYWCKSW